jgi:hypothetical protein
MRARMTVAATLDDHKHIHPTTVSIFVGLSTFSMILRVEINRKMLIIHSLQYTARMDRSTCGPFSSATTPLILHPQTDRPAKDFVIGISEKDNSPIRKLSDGSGRRRKRIQRQINTTIST